VGGHSRQDYTYRKTVTSFEYHATPGLTPSWPADRPGLPGSASALAGLFIAKNRDSVTTAIGIEVSQNARPLPVEGRNSNGRCTVCRSPPRKMHELRPGCGTWRQVLQQRLSASSAPWDGPEPATAMPPQRLQRYYSDELRLEREQDRATIPHAWGFGLRSIQA